LPPKYPRGYPYVPIESLNNAVRFIDSVIGPPTVVNATRGWGTDWSKGGVEFRATQVDAENGYFVVIERTN
jgi:hypothetical protein